MLFKIAVLLLVVWLIDAVGVYEIGSKLVHVLLLVGLMLLLLAFLKARDAGNRAVGAPPKPR